MKIFKETTDAFVVEIPSHASWAAALNPILEWADGRCVEWAWLPSCKTGTKFLGATLQRGPCPYQNLSGHRNSNCAAISLILLEDLLPSGSRTRALFKAARHLPPELIAWGRQAKLA